MILQSSLASILGGHVIEWALGIVLSINLWMAKAMVEVRGNSRATQQTLFGENGDNGINGKVKDHARELKDLDRRVTRLEP
jgi:hypothetical protein